MVFQPGKDAELATGYRLIEKLGAGGFGEVWKAAAPGGLTKAIKIVFGAMDGPQAEQELKSLGRIKEVRHPFLLSLERIDVLEGQLFVVTELAEGSLLDRYLECIRAGLPGIPRTELLAHLRDAADALDYMAQTHGLQHLDVKPQNLLLVGGRMKVADFGQVRLLANTGSTAPGVTPVYATPEAFDGRVSRFSDQYSLAVVYQEMLTGVRPFPGTTMMQLAAQHIGCQPLLAPLPAGDRSLIGRALSKVPEHRFPSCVKLVEALLKVPAGDTRPSSQPNPPAIDTGTRVLIEDSRPDASYFEVAGHTISDKRAPIDGVSSTRSALAAATPSESLFELSDGQVADSRGGQELQETVIPEEIARDQSGLRRVFEPLAGARNGVRPTLFLGIGGLAGLVLRRLKKRLRERFGDRSRTPAFGILLLDTDREDMRRIRLEDSGSLLAADETLLTPLHPPQHYRESSKKLLRWLDRRWLYGIPRSLLTQGLRPLGRLAFVDNSAEILAQIRDTIASITKPENLQATAQAARTGIRDDSPRVFIVASITGGTGSGMLISLAYGVRQLLEESSQSAAGLCGVLLHATGPKVEDREMARVNASATLTELDQLCRLGAGYPGEPESGLLSFPPGQRPFEDSYLIQFGDGLDRPMIESAANAVGDYLYLDTTPEGGGCLDRLRARDSSDADSRALFRTFGLARVDSGNEKPDDTATGILCRQLLDRWLADPGNDDLQELQRQAQREVASRGLEDRSLKLALEAAVNAATGNRPDAFIPQVLARAAAAAGNTRELAMLPYVDSAFAPPKEQRQGEAAGAGQTLHTPVHDTAESYGVEIGTALVAWLGQIVERPGKRFRAAERAAEHFKKTIATLMRMASARAARIRTRRQSIRTRLESGKPAADGIVRGSVLRQTPSASLKTGRELDEYCRLWLRETADENIVTLLGCVQAQIDAFLEETGHFCRQMRTLADRLRPPSASKVTRTLAKVARPSAAAGKASPGSSAGPVEETSLPGVVQQFDHSFDPEALEQLGWLRLTSAESSSVRRPARATRLTPEQFAEELQKRARIAIQGSAKDSDTARLFVRTHGGPESALSLLLARARAARPRLVVPHDRQHLIVVLPHGESWAGLNEMLASALHSPPGSLVRWDEEVLLCSETSGLTAPAVTRTLLGESSIPSDLVQSVMTRFDALPGAGVTIPGV